MTETVTVPIEALRNCHCPSDGRWTIGDCTDAGTCGCSIALKQRLGAPAQQEPNLEADRYYDMVSEFGNRGQHLTDALRPFIEGLGPTEAAKLINKKYPGLNPIQITVTKFQYDAARKALKDCAFPSTSSECSGCGKIEADSTHAEGCSFAPAERGTPNA